MSEGTPTVAFPERDVRLLSGEIVIVSPWKLKQGRIMRKRLTALFNKFQQTQANVKADVEVDYDALIDMFEDDVILIIRDTLGVDSEWMDEHLVYEDLFTLAQAILEVCLWRSGEGGGLMGKLLRVAGGMGVQNDPEAARQVQEKVDAARKEWAEAGENSLTKNEKATSPEVSLSSHEGGEPTPKPSESS